MNNFDITWILAGVYGRAALDLVSLCMAVYGIIEWNRDKLKKQGN